MIARDFVGVPTAGPEIQAAPGPASNDPALVLACCQVFCFCGLQQIMTVSSGRYAAAGARPRVVRRKPVVSIIEGRHAIGGPPCGPSHTPRIPMGLPFSGRFSGSAAPNVGTVTH